MVLKGLLSLIGITDEWLLEKCEPILSRLDDVEDLARENLAARKELTEELQRWEP